VFVCSTALLPSWIGAKGDTKSRRIGTDIAVTLLCPPSHPPRLLFSAEARESQISAASTQVERSEVLNISLLTYQFSGWLPRHQRPPLWNHHFYRSLSRFSCRSRPIYLLQHTAMYDLRANMWSSNFTTRLHASFSQRGNSCSPSSA
jgi:hypothetical protein